MPSKTPIGRLGLIIISLLYLTACHRQARSISFYYWKTNFQLDSAETDAIKSNQVKSVYVRYFDIDFVPGNNDPRPVSPIRFDSAPLICELIPVVYIKNRTFEQIDSGKIESLTRKVFSLVSSINRYIGQDPGEIQFDCDWTETTREKYFLFLKLYRRLSNGLLSATIRLHQVKYAGRTGIPPVDYGVLMYYNMGQINAAPASSIYEKSIAEKYNPYLTDYPLKLAAALPVFSWGLQISEGHVVKLISKLNLRDLENDSNFTEKNKNWFAVKHAGFHRGYYFKENDVIKLEYTPAKELYSMVSDLDKYAGNRIGKLIFFDLDRTNLILYEKDFFRKIAAGAY